MRIERETTTRTVLFRFDHATDYADHVERDCADPGYGSWGGARGWADEIKRTRSGDMTHVAQAEALFDQISVEAQRESSEWVPSVAGAYPVVGEFLAGRPDCMRRRTMTHNDRSPLRIVVELSSSGYVSPENLVKRGVAILALAMLINRDRACELTVTAGLEAQASGFEGGGSFVVVPLGSTPLDLAVACNALTSVGFARNMGYTFLRTRRESRAIGSWEWGIVPTDTSTRSLYVATFRKAMGLAPTDIIIPPAHDYDPAVSDPIGFVRRALAEALQAEED